MAHLEQICKIVRVEDQNSILINSIRMADDRILYGALRTPFFISQSCHVVRYSDELKDTIISGNKNTYLVKGKTRHQRKPAKMVRTDELFELRRNL